MPETGNGVTISFGTTGWAENVYSITINDQTREALESTHLGTTGEKEYEPDDLVEAGDLEVEFEWDHSSGTFPPIDQPAETITITHPLRSGQTVNATMAGTGFLTSKGGPNIENGALMRGSFVIKWDGKTGPTNTAGS